MLDPITLIVGAGIAGAGWAVGRFGRPKAKSAESLPATCGCGHDLAMHDPQTGACHTEIGRKSVVGLREWVRCGCRRYTGPQPLEELFNRPLLPPTQP
ncbi:MULTISPECIES: hypothetical protein [Nocardia]|uniref:Uncharacterized protein n=1 Tax=Nocardia arthritidis TaxID=228602 RepID=A0A6G9YNI1_9NOCA|nr:MULTISPECIES: hypothetical protein [Nocardia]QIS14637.1 hypothetical protein F5544_34010 [Nocardia arthritidis]